MKRLIPLLLLSLLTTMCSVGDDNDSMAEWNLAMPTAKDSVGDSTYYQNGVDSTQQQVDIGTGLGEVDTDDGLFYTGEFAAIWTAEGRQVGTATLYMQQKTQLVSLPVDYVMGLFQQETGRQATFAGTAWLWDMQLRNTGYSAYTYYFEMQNASAQCQLDGGIRLRLCFDRRNQLALYDKTTDSWSALLPLDSIVVENVTVCRFRPARELKLVTVKRLKD